MWLTQWIDGQLPTGPKDVKFGAQVVKLISSESATQSKRQCDKLLKKCFQFWPDILWPGGFKKNSLPVYPYNGKLFSHKKGRVTDTCYPMHGP